MKAVMRYDYMTSWAQGDGWWSVLPRRGDQVAGPGDWGREGRGGEGPWRGVCTIRCLRGMTYNLWWPFMLPEYVNTAWQSYLDNVVLLVWQALQI